MPYIHKCGGVTVVLAHEVPLSIDGANQELTRLHGGTRMVFLRTSPKPHPPSNTLWGGRFFHTKLYQENCYSVVVVLVVKRSASLLHSLRKGGNIWSLD